MGVCIFVHPHGKSQYTKDVSCARCEDGVVENKYLGAMCRTTPAVLSSCIDGVFDCSKPRRKTD